VADLVAELEARARQRFVRWDPQLWQRVLEGPARTLAASLQQAGTDADAAQRTLESYLRLACEAIGLGYLFPPEVGEGFLNHAFFSLLPRGLAELPAGRQPQVLADCWNLGENLEHAPGWWRRMFVRLANDGASLGALRALVERAEREAFGTPQKKLGRGARHLFVDLGAEDRLFLPGTLHFVAPTVVCVHDRETQRSQGVWIADPPVALGPMGCAEETRDSSDRLDLVEALAQKDPRTAEVRNSTANEWRAALSLETSQCVVALYPT
jgi:hypothetical protein